MPSVRWLGHASFEIELGGRTIIADPWFESTPERLVPPAITQQQVRRADLILISHEHFDHCSPTDVNPIVERTYAQVVAPVQALSKLEIPSRCRSSVEAGDSFSLMDINITVVPATHRSENPVGFVVSDGEKSLYFAGDTYDYYGMSEIAVDAALLPIGGKYTMDAISALKAVKMMRAKKVVPMHYGTFKEIPADPAEFCARVSQSTKTEPVPLRVGGRMEF